MSIEISGTSLECWVRDYSPWRCGQLTIVVPVAVPLHEDVPYAQTLASIASSTREALLKCNVELVAVRVVDEYRNGKNLEQVASVLVYGKLEERGPGGYYVVDTQGKSKEVRVAPLLDSDGTRRFPDGPLPPREALTMWILGFLWHMCGDYDIDDSSFGLVERDEA